MMVFRSLGMVLVLLSAPLAPAPAAGPMVEADGSDQHGATPRGALRTEICRLTGQI